MINIDLSPVAFLTFRWYGVMIDVGIVLLILWLLWQVRKGAKVSYDTIFAAAMVAIPSGIIFSRLLHVIDNIIVARLHPEYVISGAVIDYSLYPAQIIGGSGLTIYGAILGGTLGVWIYSQFSKMNFAYFADLLVPGVIIAQAVGRVGCTINGCCYGEATTLPWGIKYTHFDSLGFSASQFLPPGFGLQPTQVYEILFLALLFGAMLLLRRWLKPAGALFLVYLIFYSLWRFGIDFLRDGTPFFFGLHQAQFIAIVVIAICVPLLIARLRKPAPAEQAAAVTTRS